MSSFGKTKGNGRLGSRRGKGNLLRHMAAALLFLALLCLPGRDASAAAKKAPANVTSLRIAQRGEASVLLQWKKTARAELYAVYQVDKETGKKKRLGATPGTEYRVRDLEAGTTYYFQVWSYNKSNGRAQYSPKASNLVSGKVRGMKTPGKVSSFRITTYGDLSITMMWSAAKDASAYEIYMRESGSGDKYRRVGKTTQTFYTAKNLTKGKTYDFRVRAVRTLYTQNSYGSFSNTVSGKAEPLAMENVHGRYFQATLKTAVTVTLSDGGKMKLKKGTKVVAKTKKVRDSVTIIIANRYTAKVPGSKLNYGNLYTTTTYYTRVQAETFVNQMGISSETDSLIWVSQYTMAVYVFKGTRGQWRLMRWMPCVIGSNGLTPQRQFTIVKIGEQYGNVCLYITWSETMQRGYAIHCRSVPGVTRAASSGGCIRLGDADLDYVYNNCPIGTKVLSY